MVNADPTLVPDTPPPAAAGTSVRYERGPAFRRYRLSYVLAGLSIAAIWGAVGGILLPLHVQQIEFGQFFTGADAGIDLQALTELKYAVDAGSTAPTEEQSRQLSLLADFEAARALSLSAIAVVSSILTMLIQPIAGILSDRTRSRWGRRAPWIVAGAVIGAALLVAMRFSPSIGILLITYSLAQLGLNLASGPLNATVADRVPAERLGTMSALSGFATLIGGAIGSIVAGALFAVMGLDVYFPFALAVIVFTVLFALMARDRSSRDLERAPMSVRAFLASFTVALRDRDFRWLWIAKVALLFGGGVSGAFGVYMLQSYIRPGLSAEEAAQIAPVLALVGIPGTVVALLVAGWWSDKVGRRKPFVIGSTFLIAGSMFIPLLSPTLPALIIQGVVAGLGVGTFLTVDQAMFIDLLPEKDAAARDLGVSTLGGNLGQALGPLLAGVVVAVTGGYTALWIVAIVIVVIAALLVFPIRRVR
jgi:MFS family permease